MECFKEFLFLSDASTATTSNELANRSAGRTLIIQVTGTNTGLKLDIEGAVDMLNPTYVALSAKDAKTGTAVSEISASGIYIIDAIGISSIRANLVQISSGTVKVFGKLMTY